MVSGSRNYKNIVRGLSSLDRAAAQLNRRLPVVVTGIVSSSSEELSARYPNIDLTTLGYVPPSELTKAYKEASLLLYPSLNEGFGIPLVEAMRHGTPIAAAAIASIPEVVGDSALLFNPFDVDEMALRLYQFFEDRGMRERLGVKARSRFQFLQEQARQQWQALARDLDEVDQ